MSASNAESSIYMSDTPKQIQSKINKYAFSGGQETLEEHRRLGGNPDVDVAFNYLRHFMDDDAKLKQIEEDYRAGKLLTGELKKICIEVLQAFVKAFQEASSPIKLRFHPEAHCSLLVLQAKAQVSDEVVRSYMDAGRKIDPAMGWAAA